MCLAPYMFVLGTVLKVVEDVDLNPEYHHYFFHRGRKILFAFPVAVVLFLSANTFISLSISSWILIAGKICVLPQVGIFLDWAVL